MQGFSKLFSLSVLIGAMLLNPACASSDDLVKPAKLNLEQNFASALELQFKGNDAEANKKFQIGCDSNHAPSCNLMAQAFVWGYGLEKNQEKGFELYQKSCNLKDATGCFSVGYSYFWGIGVSKSIENAIAFYKTACHLGDGEACYNLAFNGNDKINKIEYSKENFQLFGRACEFEFTEACNIIGLFYQFGESDLDKNPQTALSYFETGCKLNDPKSCILAGKIIHGNPDVKFKSKNYMVFYEKSCELDDDGGGCELYNINARTPPPSGVVTPNQ